MHPSNTQLVGKCVLGVGFAVNEMNVAKFIRLRSHSFNPPKQFRSIAVRAVTVQHFNAGSQRNFVTKDPNGWLSLNDSAAERVLRLKADDEDGVARIMRSVREMMDDAT